MEDLSCLGFATRSRSRCMDLWPLSERGNLIRKQIRSKAGEVSPLLLAKKYGLIWSVFVAIPCLHRLGCGDANRELSSVR